MDNRGQVVRVLTVVGLVGLAAWAIIKRAQAVPPVPPPPHGLKGDLDNDGRLTSTDLDILRDWVAGWWDAARWAEACPNWSPGDEEEILWRADVNDDGAVNALDITALEALVGTA